MKHSRLHYDRQDEELLKLIDSVIENRRGEGASFAGLHPNGIIDLAVRPEIRMATAAIDLLDTLEQGQEEERLDSLRTLRDNVLVSAHTSLRYNTARVLIQIMKVLVRSQEDHESRLALAHDFRMAASGKPSVVRKLLRRYFLLEMPEEWNQAVFDDHVHDANTKGRKNATHLIMDAWVKGIRSLTVIYYNYVTVGAAHELLTAAEIMGIKVRIGILLTASFRGKAVDLIWGPRGFSDADGFLSFLNEPDVRALMEEGICATRWQEQHVVTVLRFWNANERKDLEKRLGWGIEPLDSEEFLEFVGTGQASLIHLAEYIHYSIMPDLTLEAQRISALIAAPDTSAETRKTLHARLVDLDTITPERLLEELSGCESVERTFREFSDADVPELLRQEPYPLLKRVTGLHSGNRVTLNLANLTPEDVLTLLWDCRGLITHLEIFNIKDWQEGSEPFTKEIGELQHAINEGSVPMLKQIIRSMISGCVGDEKPILGDRISLRSENLMHIAAYSSPAPTPEERTEKLHEILGGITVLQGYYKKKKLATRLGTDSTSRPGRRAGMGLAYEQSLPARARRELKANTRNSTRLRLPVRLELHEKIEYTVTDESADGPLAKIVRAIPGFRHHGMPRTRSWLPVDENCTICNEGECSQEGKDSEKCNHGNIITLGGIGKYTGNGFCPENAHPEFDPSVRLHHLNTVLENVLKILIGFIPALIAFLMTQETLFLALIGAPAFYVITAVRNIIQSLIAAGGVSSTSMRHWNYYVDWTRLCDSLMYTGLSVVLLELVVRVWVLQDMFGVNASNAPLFTYTAISLVNGAYVAGHNYLRGLPREAIIGNIFRSFFAIPVSLVYNSLFAAAVYALGFADPEVIVYSSAAILSKLASDTVAAAVESYADKRTYLKLRLWDFNTKLGQVFKAYSDLELQFPEKEALAMLSDPVPLLHALREKDPRLGRALVVNALDMMYIFYFQPRAEQVLAKLLENMGGAEQLTFLRTQKVLAAEKEVCQFFVDGLVGGNFSKALSFYLERHADYLRRIEVLTMRRKARRLFGDQCAS